jgi:CrcB protein
MARRPRDPERWDVLLVIAVGGSLGAASRWAVGEALPTPAGGFPLSTFLVNVVGSFALGVLMVLVTDVRPPSRYLRPFFGVGVLGGFTTFSTFELELRDQVVTGHALVAGAYLVASLLAGLVAVGAGIAATRLAAR